MSDMSPEEREQVERTKAICTSILLAVGEAPSEEKRLAFAMLLAQECIAMEYPDRAFLESIDAALGVFRDLSNTKYRNQDPAVS